MIDIERLAREADPDYGNADGLLSDSLCGRDAIERFAALVRNAVLEESAEVCDELADLNRQSETDSMWQQGECAAAIRALKDKT